VHKVLFSPVVDLHNKHNKLTHLAPQSRVLCYVFLLAESVDNLMGLLAAFV
jgi:hypothetical protein